MNSIMKKILIAHQSTIPHYRIPFYNALENLRPSNWQFEVVFDPRELQNKRFFKESIELSSFQFPILPVTTYPFTIANKRICYQNFWQKAGNYDLLIVENAINNLTYPLCQLHQLRGTKFAHWGHGKHRGVVNYSITKRITEKLKKASAHKANAFFAYTPGVKKYVAGQGFPAEKIFALNNTIDINLQRRAFEKFAPQKEAIKQELGLTGKKVLLFVGRFNKNKRINFLLESFNYLHKQDNSFHLLLVGAGGEKYFDKKQSNLTYFGSVIQLEKIAPLYIAADLFVFPGLVGLGPLQALCYDLPIITIDAPNHMPEVEYLVPSNSIFLPTETTPHEYAQYIIKLFNECEYLSSLKQQTWSSIKHLTIENMAKNFIEGVNKTLLT